MKPPPNKSSCDWVSPNTLQPWARNPKDHSAENTNDLARSIVRFGFTDPIEVWRSKQQIVSGHGRLMAVNLLLAEDPGRVLAIDAPEPGQVLVRWLEFASQDEADAYALAANRHNERNPMNAEKVAEIFADFEERGVSLEGIGYSDEEREAMLGGEEEGAGGEGDPKPAATLTERFGVPPFSVLDARQGYWQERKRAWLGLGIRSEIGRGGVGAYPTTGSAAGVTDSLHKASAERASPGGSRRPAARLGSDGKTERGDGVGRRLTWVAGDREDLDDTSRKILAAGEEGGTSIFDPVLCELAYRWFCPKAGAVLDPFAGGSVRGIVASIVGLAYTGIDLRAEQVEANRAQAGIATGPPPTWIVGDSRNAAALVGDLRADLVFSCPPYADLERYSDDPRDLSTLDYPAFVAAYREVIAAAVACLKPNRFAVFVVGDVRDKKGFYHDFPGDTIRAFQSVGAILYNEAILVTAVGSLSLRAGKQFQAGRKLGKTHQNVLVFFKGDPRTIRDTLGDVECGPDLDEGAPE